MQLKPTSPFNAVPNEAPGKTACCLLISQGAKLAISSAAWTAAVRTLTGRGDYVILIPQDFDCPDLVEKHPD
ncbi:hypothetical protein WJX77_008333 [Trebouxia sp. C0004]